MADAVSIKFDASGAYAALDRIGVAVSAQTRPAAQAGAQVLYDEVKLRAPVAKKPRKTKGGRVILPGALKASIYQAYSADNSSATRATYHVSWNYRKAPHGHLVEFGHKKVGGGTVAAHPFLRPAFDTKAGDALEAAKAKWVAGAGHAIAGLKA